MFMEKDRKQTARRQQTAAAVLPETEARRSKASAVLCLADQ
jgi:hypothetical protein